MTEKPEICAICAWRLTCQKKYNLSGRDVRCPDFSKDLSLEESQNDDKEGSGKED